MKPMLRCGATFSPCRRYRYLLTREWKALPLHRVLFIMLNPSTADEIENDPTVTRTIGFARRWGYDALDVVNLFAFRATDPDVMKFQVDPVGPANASTITRCARYADAIVCAWGVHGDHLSGGIETARRLRAAGFVLRHLGLTKEGHPKHPLYIRADTEPVEWRP